ncbi:MAG TPA: hypothetical protein PKL78_10750 [Anaerolineales bacterium]|nr:hypothetical protein [Anaerolineales bacterium]HNO30821.1 hypothetical protein [Anaerolineales bacterium]
MQDQTQHMPCPKCGQSNAKPVQYTWWGGMLGPRLFSHVKCQSCATQYNGKTGKSNQQNIIIYTIISFVLVFCICGGLTLVGAILQNQ